MIDDLVGPIWQFMDLSGPRRRERNNSLKNSSRTYTRSLLVESAERNAGLKCLYVDHPLSLTAKIHASSLLTAGNVKPVLVHLYGKFLLSWTYTFVMAKLWFVSIVPWPFLKLKVELFHRLISSWYLLSCLIELERIERKASSVMLIFQDHKDFVNQFCIW